MPILRPGLSAPPVWVPRLRQALAKLNRDQTWQAELSRRQIDGWSNGGCLILAEAIRGTLGPKARLVGIRGRRGRLVQHVAVERDGWFADIHDVRDQSDLLYDAETIGDFRDPVIVPFVLPGDAVRHRIPYVGHEDLVRRLRDQLSPSLSPRITKRTVRQRQQ